MKGGREGGIEREEGESVFDICVCSTDVYNTYNSPLLSQVFYKIQHPMLWSSYHILMSLLDLYIQLLIVDLMLADYWRLMRVSL